MKIRRAVFFSLKLGGAVGIIVVIMHLVFFIFMAARVSGLKKNNPETTSIMRFRNKPRDFSGRKPSFTELSKIPADITSCIIFIEDADFFNHIGFDFDSIKLAIKVNKKLGYKVYGGSTITQQLARTLFLTPRKNYLRKYLELLIAVEMEIFLAKERILELYLNFAEWGKSIYGITDAALHYYNKGLRELDDEEKLSLITIMANPIDYSPATFRVNNMLVRRYNSLIHFYTEMKALPPEFKSTIKEINQ